MSALIRTIFPKLASSIGAGLVGFKSSMSGAVARKVSDEFEDQVSVKRFGAKGDGTTDDTAAIVLAIAACKLALRNLYFPAGIYKITSTIALTGDPIALIGEDNAPMQQGSTRPSVTLRWFGGAAPMFTMASSAWSFVGMAADNFGTATDFIDGSAGTQFLHMKRMSFLLGNGATRFSRSVIYSLGNNFGYSRFETIHCLGAAPKFLYINGNGSSNGLTPVEICGRSLFESNSGGTMTVVHLKDENMDSLHIHDCTFNQQENIELRIVDTSDTPLSYTITQLTFEDNEIDIVGNVATHRMFKLTNVKNIAFNKNAIQGGGNMLALADLIASTVTSFENNWGESLGGPVFACDANSRVYPGHNQFNNANTNGIASDPGTGKGGGVLQVVSAKLTTQTALGTSYADLISATITPLNKTSKILVIANVNGLAVTGTTTSIQARIAVNTNPLYDIEKEAGYAGVVTTELALGGIGATFMDAPASTTALTYKIQIQKTGGSNAYACVSGSASTITLMEIAG